MHSRIAATPRVRLAMAARSGPLGRACLPLALALAGGTLQAHARATVEVGAPGPLALERVIVTASTDARSVIRSSISSSTLEGADIEERGAASAAELLSAVPGVRAEASGGEGNANISVRGVPVSAGGARYVQFQEDGLPLLQAGDVAFFTADSLIRLDASIDHLEVVRGGSASTMASNAPAAIVNFISKDGQVAGGAIGVSRTLGRDGVRVDAEYGGALDPRTRFFIAAHRRHGDQARASDAARAHGGQIRANLTRQFGNGFVRVYVKHLDDRAPTALPVPVQVRDGVIAALPDFDPRSASLYSPYWVPDVTLSSDNGKRASAVNDGLMVRSSSVGLAAELAFDGGWRWATRMRVARNSGRFSGVFPADNGDNGGPAAYRFATGPQAGLPYSGRALRAVVFNTRIDDAGNTVSDTRVSNTVALAGGAKVTATAAWYSSVQTFDLTWNFNEYLLQASAYQPALLDTGNATPGLVGPAFGACCSRTYAVRYRLDAPYLDLGLEQGAWNLDASVRRDRQRAAGSANIASGGLAYLPATEQSIDYRVARSAYSVGANYRVGPALALFARSSSGGAFNADRILFRGPLDGSAPISTNTVKQREGGVKWRRAAWTAFLTLFHSATAEANFEVTTGTRTAYTYRASGAELELGYRAGAWTLHGGATATAARITAAEPGAQGVVGNTPRRQAALIYQAAAGYTSGRARLGVALVGTGRSWGDDAHSVTLPAYRVVHGFVRYQVSERIGLALYANNLFNVIGYTEVEPDGHAARSISGRVLKLRAQYAW